MYTSAASAVQQYTHYPGSFIVQPGTSKVGQGGGWGGGGGGGGGGGRRGQPPSKLKPGPGPGPGGRFKLGGGRAYLFTSPTLFESKINSNKRNAKKEHNQIIIMSRKREGGGSLPFLYFARKINKLCNVRRMLRQYAWCNRCAITPLHLRRRSYAYGYGFGYSYGATSPRHRSRCR